MWTTSDGSAINRTSRNGKNYAFREFVLESDTHPPGHGCLDRDTFRVSDVFTRGRGGLPNQPDDVGQGRGVSKKSVFARTSLMDDPLYQNFGLVVRLPERLAFLTTP